MSCHYGVKCLTCKVESDYVYNHGEHIIQGMLAALPHIAAAIEADKSGYLEIRFLGDYENVLDFTLAHKDHELGIGNEYE